MPVKFNHYWNIIPDKAKDYKKFILNTFIPEMNKFNINVVSGWSIIVGSYSEVILESVASDLEVLEKGLRHEKFIDLKAKLFDYVSLYKTKVLVPTHKDIPYSRELGEYTIKFNQLWDIIPGKHEDYKRYTNEEFYPCLEELGIKIAGKWQVLFGGSPQVLCEGRVKDVDSLINNLRSDKFIKAKYKLKNFIYHYESRLLSFHIQKIKGYKSTSYEMILL
jgi:hypothetical protein